MTHAMPDDLWRDCLRAAAELESRSATEEDCRAYWIAARWGGEPAYVRCASRRVWTIRSATTFECADCDHDDVQARHWTTSLLKRWPLCTHAGAVRDKHRRGGFNEFTFHHNWRRTSGVGRIAARLIESLVAKAPLTRRKQVDGTRRCRWFGSSQPAAA